MWPSRSPLSASAEEERPPLRHTTRPFVVVARRGRVSRLGIAGSGRGRASEVSPPNPVCVRCLAAFEPPAGRPAPWPQIRQGYPLNLSILLSGGKETNKDSPSNGE